MSHDGSLLSMLPQLFFTSWATREAPQVKASCNLHAPPTSNYNSTHFSFSEESEISFPATQTVQLFDSLYTATSLTQWPWVSVNSGSWWWTGRPGVLQSMGSQRVRHNWATELNWTEQSIIVIGVLAYPRCIWYSKVREAIFPSLHPEFLLR